MSQEDLEKQLEKIRKSVSPDKFIDILLGSLAENPSIEDRDTYQAWLQAYGHKDKRIVEYWEKLLFDNDKWQKERAINNLFALCETGTALACEVLRRFLGEEPTREAIKTRLVHLLNLE